MNKLPVVAAIAAILLVGCDKQTRDGDLALASSAPLRLIDEGGKTVEFPAGATKIVLDAGFDRKFTAVVSQGDARQATFKGKIPSGTNDWNMTVRGAEIGQPVDIASARVTELYGRRWSQTRDSAEPCGYNGRWVVEDNYSQCREDWALDFTGAADAVKVARFHSHKEDMSCLVDTRHLYCRDQMPPPPPPPHPRHLPEKADDVKFD